MYYYLGDYGEALSFALNAGTAFAEEGRTPGAEEYVETVICEFLFIINRTYLTKLHEARAIDRYVEERTKEQGDLAKIDPKLQSIIESILERCVQDGEYKQVR